MHRYFLLTLLLITNVTAVIAQPSLYMPRDVEKAYKKGTRSMDGMPGRNYWQNHGTYDINITALPPDRNVMGTETIIYVNNSPDTIRVPNVKLFLNIHKPGAPRDRGADADYLTTGMHIDEVTVNDQLVKWEDDPNSFTERPFRLPKPLYPHESAKFYFKWHYQISLQSGREGMIDSTTYFLAYFYPRIAVYDDYNGWDRMPFTDGKEFYSDFNDYTVSITAPANYIVWGTGTLQNPESLLQPEYAKRFRESLTSDKVVHVASAVELASKRVTAQHTTNSWEFKATNVPDMAFGMSDHFVWDAGSVIVDDATGRRASVQAAYNDTAKDYHRMVEYGKHSLDWLSHNWPGVPYPYEKTTIFHGYAGMEYPMMANDETYEDTVFSRFVAEHEIAHSYMPFYMGINETRYGFMDEGWATTFELLIGTQDLGKDKAESFYRQFRVGGWISNASADEDIPIITPGNVLNGGGLGNNEYGKASLGYLAMKDMLGDALFKKCLQEYMNRWHGKHPIPWDFFFTFNDVSKRNLNWFWNNWYFNPNYIDLAIVHAGGTGSNYSIDIKNIGRMPAPVNINITYTDGSKESFHQTAAIWEKNSEQTTVTIPVSKKVESIELNGGIFMDADRSNNSWKEK